MNPVLLAAEINAAIPELVRDKANSEGMILAMIKREQERGEKARDEFVRDIKPSAYQAENTVK